MYGLFAPARKPRAYVYALQNAHLKTMNHFTGILESATHRPIGKFEASLVIIQDANECGELVSASCAVVLAAMLRAFKTHTTLVAEDGTALLVLAMELGRTQLLATAEDVVVILHAGMAETQQQHSIDFLSKQTVRGVAVRVVDVTNYFRVAPQARVRRLATTTGYNHADIKLHATQR